MKLQIHTYKSCSNILKYDLCYSNIISVTVNNIDLPSTSHDITTIFRKCQIVHQANLSDYFPLQEWEWVLE